jgi:hypothetical protein
MTTFTKGQTVTYTSAHTGNQTHGLVTDVYTHSDGKEKVIVFYSRKSPPITYYASQLTAYVVQSPDMVCLMDDHGGLWAYEVLDVNVSGDAVLLQDDEGMAWVPLTQVTRVIPATIARLMRLYGDAS